ncbi:hypothetical protein Hanom_Chr01g00039551 [Helianthus anomalus]
MLRERNIRLNAPQRGRAKPSSRPNIKQFILACYRLTKNNDFCKQQTHTHTKKTHDSLTYFQITKIFHFNHVFTCYS